jgi:glycosyltransferase involved in cell wall biosynthesis
MPRTATLSVVVACYNVAAHLDRCLGSLRDQALSAGDYEIIVVDDGSTDGSGDVAARHAAADARVVVHRQSNQGVSAARNAGFDRARGRYVYFVDGDDYVVRQSLPPVLRAMQERHLDLAWVGWRRVSGGDDEPVPTDQEGLVPADGGVHVTGLSSGIEHLTGPFHYPTSAWSCLIEASLLEQAGVRFEVGRLFEDQLFVAGALAAAAHVGTVDVDVYRYVIRADSITRTRDPVHERRLLEGFERVVHGLEELRQRTLAEGSATPAFLDRLSVIEQGYVFLLISKIVRSSVPLRPLLQETLARLEATGSYPLTRYPDDAHAGWRYRMLGIVFSHRASLYPFAALYRMGAVVRRRLPARG